MKCIKSIVLLLFISIDSNSQQSRFSLEANYGLNGNFFVSSYDEITGPADKTYFYNKNFLGTVGGIEMAYRTGKKSSLIAGYSRSVNASTKKYSGLVGNAEVYIGDFKIRHYNNVYYAGYKHCVTNKKNKFSVDAGPVLIYYSSQKIGIYSSTLTPAVGMFETNYKNSRTVEGGVFGGIQFERKIDNHFNLGIKLRGYYLISVSWFEMLTLTPTLSYTF